MKDKEISSSESVQVDNAAATLRYFFQAGAPFTRSGIALAAWLYEAFDDLHIIAEASGFTLQQIMKQEFEPEPISIGEGVQYRIESGGSFTEGFAVLVSAGHEFFVLDFGAEVGQKTFVRSCGRDVVVSGYRVMPEELERLPK